MRAYVPESGAWRASVELTAPEPQTPWEQEDIPSLISDTVWAAYEQAVLQSDWTPWSLKNLLPQVCCAHLIDPARGTLSPDRLRLVRDGLTDVRQRVVDQGTGALHNFVRMAGQLAFFVPAHSIVSSDDLDRLGQAMLTAMIEPADSTLIWAYLSLLDRARFQMPEVQWSEASDWILGELEDDEYEVASDFVTEKLASLMILDPDRADALRTPESWDWMVRYLQVQMESLPLPGSDKLAQCAYLRIIAAGGVEQRPDGVWQLRQPALTRANLDDAPVRQRVRAT